MLIPAANVAEAVSLATGMKQAGTYEWFRGQTRNWTLASSLVRRADTYEQELTRARQFFGWLRITPGLEALASDDDQATAVAQHYGLATHFIDFTTEPAIAGYFASEGIAEQAATPLDLDAEKRRFFSSQPATEHVGCILCLSRTKLRSVWESVVRSGLVEADHAIDFLELTVPDLWRLEAQHGVFFYCPAGGFEEAIYDLDRIVFPHTGQVRSPVRALIYPERKSHLELQLEHYFQLEQISRGMDHIREELRDAPMQVVNFGGEQPRDLGDNRYLRDGSLPVHESWNQQILEGFINPKPEKFWTAVAPLDCELTLSEEMDTTTSIATQLRRFFRDEPQCRSRLVTWTVSSDVAWREESERGVTAIFDATRALPIADEEIVVSIANAVALLALRHKGETAIDGSRAFFGGQTIAIEIATHSASYTRGWVTLDGIQAALRDDFAELLTDAGRKEYADLKNLLLDIQSPERLFVLDRFTTLLLRQFVPTQVVWRSDLPVVASPARVQIFGLP